MSLFSERNKYVEKPLQIETMSNELRNRIWNTYIMDIDTDRKRTNYLEEIMDACGLRFVKIYVDQDVYQNLGILERWFNRAEWYRIYDFVEVYLSYLRDGRFIQAKQDFNAILQAENASYRIIGNKVGRITNQAEIECIEEAQSTEYENVNTHIQKATKLFSQRPNPDYENSIKESISAVEALCSIITGMTGKSSTLGNTIKHLKDKGVHIHPAMESAYSSLYGFTNDEGGIRHGRMDFKDAPAEDAKYMLVSCSAFVNYLMEKWSKVSSS